MHRCICIEKKNQLDAPEWFIALIIRSTCFGHFRAHHQELETICVITAYGVQCLVACCRESGARQQAIRPGRGMLHDAVVQHPSSWTHSLLPCTWPPTTSNQALHTIGGNKTHTHTHTQSRALDDGHRSSRNMLSVS